MQCRSDRHGRKACNDGHLCHQCVYTCICATSIQLYAPIYLSICPLYLHTSIYRAMHTTCLLHDVVPVYKQAPPIYPPVYPSIQMPIYLSIQPSTKLNHLSLSVCLSIGLSTQLDVDVTHMYMGLSHTYIITYVRAYTHTYIQPRTIACMMITCPMACISPRSPLHTALCAALNA